MVKAHWQEQFKDSIKNAKNLYSENSTNVSLLLFCLRSKMIPIQAYLEWAKQNYGLPLLSDKFFQDHQPQQVLYKKWQSFFNWSAECLPIAEWDGSLIVACLQVPDDFKQTQPATIFVLTSHETLDIAWGVYQKSPLKTENDFSDMTAFAATVIAPAKNANFFGDDGELVLQDDGASSEEAVEKFSEESVPIEVIEGLDLSGGSDAGSSIPEGFFGNPPAPNEVIGNFDKTMPTSLNPMNLEVTKEIEIELPKIATVIKNTGPIKGPRSSQPLMSPKIESLDEKTTIDPIDETDENDLLMVSMPETKTISPMAKVPPRTEDLPSAPVKPTTDPSITETYLLEKIRKKDKNNFDKQALASFQQLKTFFKKSMLLAIGDNDRMVKPIFWDGSGFDNHELENPPLSTEFNLKTPSIFRVVSGTHKPYHGYVVVNDLNESFFESWNHGQIPDHVTIVPLFDGDLAVGMLMGFGEKSSYNKNILNFTENVGKDLSQKILKNSVPKAA